MSRVSLGRALLCATAFIVAPTEAVSAATVWSGLTHTFTKAAFTDPTVPANQDRLTENVWLTRAVQQGIFNIRTEGFYSPSAPAGTRWATELNNPGVTVSAANFANLTFTNWIDAYGGAGSQQLPTRLTSNNAVVHLVTDDIYLDLRFTSWGQSNGAFAYQRARGSITPPPKTWAVDANANTSTPTNWSGGIAPGGVGDQVVFGNIITADRVITVDASFTAGSLTFNDNNNYRLEGPGQITLDAATAPARLEVKADNGPGFHTIHAPITLADDTTVNVAEGALLAIPTQLTVAPALTITKTGPGRLSLRNVRTDALAVDDGTVIVIPSGTNDATSRVSSLTFATTTSALDLTNNDLVIDGGDLTQITARIASGQLTTSSATDFTTLGVILNGNRFTTFSGQQVSPDDVLVKYTYIGDTNLDGRVNISDYLAADRGAARGLTGWANGDFNYSGAVDAADFFLMDSAFLNQSGQLATPSLTPVPEPTFAATGLLALPLLRRARRDRR